MVIVERNGATRDTVAWRSPMLWPTPIRKWQAISPITVVGVLESSEDGFNILLTSPKDVPATTAEAELTAEPWNEGTVQTGEPPSFHLRI